MKKSAARSPELCPRFHFAVELIGRRWTGAILYLLAQAPARYSDLRAAVPGITDPMLAERLHELEHEGLVERALPPGAAARVQYTLTPKGRALEDVLRALGRWSHDWLPEAKARPKAVPAATRRKAARATTPR